MKIAFRKAAVSICESMEKQLEGMLAELYEVMSKEDATALHTECLSLMEEIDRSQDNRLLNVAYGMAACSMAKQLAKLV
jgi:hypothetical protein